MPSVMQTISGISASMASRMRVGGEGRRDIDRGGVGPGLGDRVMHAVEDGQAEVLGPALAGGHAADHLRAVGDGLFGVEGALAAGEALADDAGGFVDENGHFVSP